MGILTQIFGDSNGRVISKLQGKVEEISALENDFEKLSAGELKSKTTEFRGRLQKGEELDSILPEAFAAVREAAKRTLGQRHYDVQLIGGMVMHEGKIAEMKTGEGKTLVATLPAYLNALPAPPAGGGVHIVTVNDYLSRRDGAWMGQIYHALGLTVGVINHESSFLYDPRHGNSADELDKTRDTLGSFKVVHEFLKPVSRAEAYAADITYGTNNEFGFDYLRDNMAYAPEQMVQRGHNFAIVDEVDSILIDEARTPLIISAPDAESGELYRIFSRVAPQLKEGKHYDIDEKLRAVSITEEGIDKVEQMLGIENIYTEKGIKYVHHLEQALRAQALFHKDKQYVLKNGEVVIVDEFTGRLMPGRRWSEGLHQAIEAKEGVEIQKESRTFATITFQNYFRMYKKLSGMTGTAMTSAEEFHKVYNLEVVEVPTNKPMIRKDAGDRVYQTEAGKIQAVVREVKERYEKGQPVLIGTVSIEKNERLSEYLKREGIPHELLNAKNHEREAEIIAQAGRTGAVTVATNMAGRGVDIILGGNPLVPEEAKKVREAGGLLVIGTERHEARRIDNQLRGRSGRQGDPGETQFFISLEDDLMRIFGSDRIKNMMGRFGIPEDQPIEHKLISRSIEAAQEKIEGFNFDSRKHILEYDDVMNKQRTSIYERRKKILFGTDEEIKKTAEDYIFSEIQMLVQVHASGEEKNIEELAEGIKARIGADAPEKLYDELVKLDDEEKIQEYLNKIWRETLSKKKQNMAVSFFPTLRQVLLQTIDMLWVEHLEAMEYMRSSVRLRAYGQRDPLIEYKNEAIRLFRELESSIRTQFSHLIFRVGEVAETKTPQARELKYSQNSQSALAGVKSKNEVGRNDPCPCGSGKKYKRCHGA
ncbi:preprotein translocase subunit SecA [Candidatus Giovannonibacteria bacterium]|nr:preprotein translocase subunit SecA [Candidatus Giovannonibacteria bacterium]